MTADDARDRFAAARIARLATADPQGHPHIVPIVFAVCKDTVYNAVDDKPKRTTALKRLANIQGNPHVALLVDHYEEDWSALWWVRAEGRARLLDPDGAEAQRATMLLAERYPQQRARAALIAIDIRRWSGWSANEGG